MRKGTKIGWILVAVSLVLSIWVIIGGSSKANQTVDDAYILNDDGTELIQYIGTGGTVTIPDGVVTIDAGVFYNTDASGAITSVTMPSSVTTMGSAVFQGCTGLQSVSLSSSLTSIPDNTFRECTSLSSVTVPSSVTSIGSNAFYGCTSMASVSIPAGVTSISLDAFQECSGLTDISVTSGNSYYSSSDGALYNVSGTRLLLVPEGKSSLTIASTATVIGSGAFSGCDSLSSLTIPSNVTAIESNAFTGSAISTITIPATTTSIGEQSSWTPTTIYGYSDSAAETYAMDHSIPFIVVGESSSDDGGDDNSGGTSTDENGNTVDENGNVVDANGNIIQAAGTNGATGSHVKDATPTTADGIDSRYFLCLAIFLGGVGVIIFSKKNKMTILQEKSQNK